MKVCIAPLLLLYTLLLLPFLFSSLTSYPLLLRPSLCFRLLFSFYYFLLTLFHLHFANARRALALGFLRGIVLRPALPAPILRHVPISASMIASTGDCMLFEVLVVHQEGLAGNCAVHVQRTQQLAALASQTVQAGVIF